MAVPGRENTTSRYLCYFMVLAIAKMRYRRGKRKRRKAFYNQNLNTHTMQNELEAAPKTTKTQDDRKQILDTTKKCALFQSLDDHQREGLIDAFVQRDIREGEILFRQGDEGAHFYIIKAGEFNILEGGVNMEKELNETSALSKREHYGKIVRTLAQGAYFGEIALLYSCPRSATVQAKTASVVWEIARNHFQWVLRSTHFKKHGERMEFMKTVPVLQGLSVYQRSSLAQSLKEMDYTKGQTIIQQGQHPGEHAHFYIIQEGQCLCVIQGEDDKIEKTLKKGDYFGEVTLLRNCPYTATITVSSDKMRLLALPRNAFERQLGPVEEVLAEKMAEYKFEADLSKDHQKKVVPETKERQLTVMEKARQRLKNIALKDLRVTKVLGTGMFGRVRLAREVKTQDVYALKVMEKLTIIQLDQVNHVRSEADIQKSLNSPFIVNLFATFQDKHSLYLLLEYVKGGDLFDDMQDKEKYPVTVSQFYAAEVLLALEYIHSEGIAYRDLKPENILLTSKGHLKLADFGLAKRVEDKAWTLCGTPEYVAPEILTGQGHNTSVDWWSYGVLIYEMLFGYPPFEGDNRVALYAQICRGDYEIPPEATPEAADLIKKLLVVDVTKRLGCLAGKARDIKAHPFFRSMDWEGMMKMTVPVPFVPNPKKGNSATDDTPVDLEKANRNKPAATPAQQALFEGF
eukprot:TRINITY_DN8860_c0_g1::TRINITY_DN8860_c0_g1_i1::g.19045::m.19045 TRINITY_DN8860_c0_g1::TRINITY_DN8860_c0_g1_i1::g.19045  ORF type:complete len:727 (-),score=139.60,sp/Q03042/KGP1_DROME/34.71/1e-107,Pkinase/PF00069.20/4.9e-68,cNMP_binding/PF00027.24/1.5e-20,cNMP_binding/PF00027.24/1.3e-15,cNMP_binding/PF00027.24/8.6e+03,Pkinase_Tyr/PF07714.12/2e+03,Pkinase_Tyr/PF07714.12/3.6e-34,Kinase-like/PF14531.1/9.2e-05,Vps53_N/PF04100.7/0.0044,Kdo/PF06293.9/4.2e+02,Kdo/PF06293.9/0.024,Cupin_2/PF07883.6/2.1e+